MGQYAVRYIGEKIQLIANFGAAADITHFTEMLKSFDANSTQFISRS